MFENMVKKLALKIESIEFEIHSLNHLINCSIESDDALMVKSFYEIQKRIFNVIMHYEKKYTITFKTEVWNAYPGPNNSIIFHDKTHNEISVYRYGVFVERWKFPFRVQYYHFDLKKQCHVLEGDGYRLAFEDDAEKTLITGKYDFEIEDDYSLYALNNTVFVDGKAIYQNSHIVDVFPGASIMIMLQKNKKQTIIMVDAMGKFIAKYHVPIDDELYSCFLMSDNKTICCRAWYEVTIILPE